MDKLLLTMNTSMYIEMKQYRLIIEGACTAHCDATGM